MIHIFGRVQAVWKATDRHLIEYTSHTYSWQIVLHINSNAVCAPNEIVQAQVRVEKMDFNKHQPKNDSWSKIRKNLNPYVWAEKFLNVIRIAGVLFCVSKKAKYINMYIPPRSAKDIWMRLCLYGWFKNIWLYIPYLKRITFRFLCSIWTMSTTYVHVVYAINNALVQQITLGSTDWINSTTLYNVCHVTVGENYAVHVFCVGHFIDCALNVHPTKSGSFEDTKRCKQFPLLISIYTSLISLRCVE